MLASLIAFELEAEESERTAREAADRLASQAQELARLEERERIAMDLHDGVIQSLYAVVLGLGVHQLGTETRESRQGLDHAIDRINAVIKDIRNNIFDLRLADLGTQGLGAGIELLAEELRVNTLVRPYLDLAPDADSLLGPDSIRNLLHIAREATSNVIRHAHATTVAIRLARVDGWLELSIRDNGQEFEVPPAGTQAGNGLRNIHERARLSGGAASVTSLAGQGTEVMVRVPVVANT